MVYRVHSALVLSRRGKGSLQSYPVLNMPAQEVENGRKGGPSGGLLGGFSGVNSSIALPHSGPSFAKIDIMMEVQVSLNERKLARMRAEGLVEYVAGTADDKEYLPDSHRWMQSRSILIPLPDSRCVAETTVSWNLFKCYRKPLRASLYLP
jgi:hypothetical protein